MFRRWILTAILLPLGGCTPLFNYTDPDGPRYSGSYASPSPTLGEHFTVASFNIQFSENIDQAIIELQDAPAMSELDVLLLQEMDDDGTDAIAQALEMDYVYYPASIHHHGRDFGNAVLSRWPIIEDEKILLPHKSPTNQQRRTATRATIDVQGEHIVVYSVHTETIVLSLQKRVAQVRTLLTDAPQDGRVVIGGDFNTSGPWASTFVPLQFTAAEFCEVTDGVGSTASMGPMSRQIDHIFVRGFGVAQSGRITDSIASDHLPVWTHLTWDDTQCQPY